MCFSANASFSSGVILSVIGIFSIKKVKKPRYYPFAVIPLIFSIQQFTEGFLWLSLSDPDYAILKKPTTETFLFFAQVIWPFFVPVSVALLDTKKERNRIHYLFVALGALISLYLAYCLVFFPVEASIAGHHISYLQDYPMFLKKLGGIIYVVATIAPPFFSNSRRLWVLGLFILASYLITAMFYADYIVSVWCFFAAVISAIIYLLIPQVKKEPTDAFGISNRSPAFGSKQ